VPSTFITDTLPNRRQANLVPSGEYRGFAHDVVTTRLVFVATSKSLKPLMSSIAAVVPSGEIVEFTSDAVLCMIGPMLSN
jgi:hypothetical protein